MDECTFDTNRSYQAQTAVKLRRGRQLTVLAVKPAGLRSMRVYSHLLELRVGEARVSVAHCIGSKVLVNVCCTLSGPRIASAMLTVISSLFRSHVVSLPWKMEILDVVNVGS